MYPTPWETLIKRTAVVPALLAVYHNFRNKKSGGYRRHYPLPLFLTKYPRTAGPQDKVRPFSISNNIYFAENKRSNLSILGSQGELAGTLLISQMPSGEGVLTREKVGDEGF